mgnify:CR=1 FL=1
MCGGACLVGTLEAARGMIVQCAPKRWMELSSMHIAMQPKHLPSSLMIRSKAKYSTKNKQSNFKAMP